MKKRLGNMLRAKELEDTSLGWARLACLLIVVGATAAAMGAARECGASTLIVVLCSVGGLAFGFALGEGQARLAFSALRSDSLPSWLNFTFYMLIPFLGIVVGILVPLLVGIAVSQLAGRA